jgi:uncharacterized protein YndB with AHSA1/START domain
MTRQRTFKRIVRARMEKTGESYTAARAALLTAADDGMVGAAPPTAADDAAANGAGPAGQTATIETVRPTSATPLATSDAAIRERTGRGWEEWFDLLDEWGAAERSHRDVARQLAELLQLHPLAWNVQAVIGSYERARGLRQVGEHADGFAITASKTVAVPVEVLFDAFVAEERRARWLPDAALRERTATRPRSARFDWDGGPTRVHVTFAPKGDGRATATVSHERLPDAAAAERMKQFWRGRVATLKEVLEG